jgi:hypothetical protein
LFQPNFIKVFKISKWVYDEDINTSATIIPSIKILDHITWSQAQQLNHQVNSLLCSSTYNIESRLLSNNLIVLKNHREDYRGQTEHQKCARESRRRAREVANQSNSELSSSSPTRSTGSSHIQINVQIAYDLRFGRFTYARKAKEITFPMKLVLCSTKIESSIIIKIVLIFRTVFGAAPPFWPDGPCIQLESIRDAS